MENQGTNLSGTFHRRLLPNPAIAFGSSEGKKLFAEALQEGNLNGYFQIADHFSTQAHPAFCGLGSLSMALNSLLIDPNRVWQGVWRWFDESMLDCCEPLDVIKVKGITITKLRCLAHCNGANTSLQFASNITLEQFRQDIKQVCSLPEDSPKSVMIVSYSRKVLKQSGSGHFSPIGAYNASNDMVLIMDVARFKYPPHWVPLTLLFEAMLPIDEETGKSRGYLLLSASDRLYKNCECKISCCSNTSCSSYESDARELPIDESILPVITNDERREKLNALLQHDSSTCSCGQCQR